MELFFAVPFVDFLDKIDTLFIRMHDFDTVNGVGMRLVIKLFLFKFYAKNMYAILMH